MDNDKSWTVMVILTFIALVVACTFAYLEMQEVSETPVQAVGL
jgi:hypothetical protein